MIDKHKKINCIKKKILSGVFVVAIAAIAAVNVNFNSEAENALSALNMANVEALADGESSGNNYNLCYSESKVRTGYTYYACGDCPNKVYDEQGKGTVSKCFY